MSFVLRQMAVIAVTAVLVCNAKARLSRNAAASRDPPVAQLTLESRLSNEVFSHLANERFKKLWKTELGGKD